MCIYIYIFTIYFNVYLSNGGHSTNKEVIKASDIAEEFLTLFDNDTKHYSKRIRDLKGKLSKINSYIINSDRYENLILHTSKQNDLKQTNFYNALIEQDHFRLLNNTKSLYLALKEKMNSDDLLNILTKREESKDKLSARRVLTGDSMLKLQREKDLAETVDNYLSEVAMDDHRFDDNYEESVFWDPKIELEERQMYQHPNRRIYKGERTTIRHYPFVVSIHVMGQFWCGGSLYWRDLVITSAACLQLMHNNRFFRENPRSVSVRVGSNHSRYSGEVIDAHEVFFHPAYNPKTLENNIALIRLIRQVHLNHHQVPKLIQISQNDQGIPFTAVVLLLGWGVTKPSGKMPYEPTFLQRKFLPVYPSKFCQEVYGNKFNQHHMFCAGTVTTGEGACSHDAGGPAILNGKLVGIISYGPTICGFPDAPTVLTMVGFYADWIETINDTMPGYYRGRYKTTTTTESPIEILYEEYIATVRPVQVHGLRANLLSKVDSMLDAEKQGLRTKDYDENIEQNDDSPMKDEDKTLSSEKDLDNNPIRIEEGNKYQPNYDTTFNMNNKWPLQSTPSQLHQPQYKLNDYAMQAGNMIQVTDLSEEYQTYKTTESTTIQRTNHVQYRPTQDVVQDIQDIVKTFLPIRDSTRTINPLATTRDDEEIEPVNDLFLLSSNEAKRKERSRLEVTTKQNIPIVTRATANYRHELTNSVNKIKNSYVEDDSLTNKILNLIGPNQLYDSRNKYFENLTTPGRSYQPQKIAQEEQNMLKLKRNLDLKGKSKRKFRTDDSK